jgi:Arm DNA-binding domain
MLKFASYRQLPERLEQTKMATKIGVKAVEAMPPNSVLWDDKIRGFCARRQFSDVVTHSAVYRTLDDIQRWHKIGRHGVFTPDQARREAARVLRAVALGEDPSAERKALRHSITVAQLIDEHQRRENGKRWWRCYV